MKKTKFLLIVFVVGLAFSSCNGNAGTDSDKEDKATTQSNPLPETTDNDDTPVSEVGTTYQVGQIALDKIVINETEYDFTAQVYVNGAKIVGKTNENNFAGVFKKNLTVILSPFIMSKYEVTQELYTAVMTDQKVTVNGVQRVLGNTPFYSYSETCRFPLVEGEVQKYRAAEGMTWYDAVYFCNALSEKIGLTKAYTIEVTSVENYDTGSYPPPLHITAANVTLVENANGYRLPTEAEWEFAARGGNPLNSAWDYAFSGSPTGKVSIAANAQTAVFYSNKNTGMDSVGWYKFNTNTGITGEEGPSDNNPGYGPHQVGSKGENSCNSLGLYDMSGNVEEWCYDLFGSKNITGSVTNPTGPSSADPVCRIKRGGYWSSDADYCTVCSSQGVNPDSFSPGCGFRIVRSVE